MIPLYLAVEDSLSEGILRRLLRDSHNKFAIGSVFSKGGNGYLRSRISAWNKAAIHYPFLVLTDLDNSPCPSTLVREWLPVERHPNLIFRVAVREVLPMPQIYPDTFVAHNATFQQMLNRY